MRRATTTIAEITPSEAGGAAARLWSAAPRPVLPEDVESAAGVVVWERTEWLCSWAQTGSGGRGASSTAARTIADLTAWLLCRPILGTRDHLGEHDLPEKSGDDVEIVETVLLAATCRRALVADRPVTTRQLAALASISPSYVQAMIAGGERIADRLVTTGRRARGRLVEITPDSATAMLASRGVPPWGRSKA